MENNKLNLSDMNLGAVTAQKFHILILSVLPDNKKLIYKTMFQFFEDVSYESEDLFPLAEDIDKRRELKYKLALLLKEEEDLNIIFNKMCEEVINYEVVDEDILNKYKLKDNKIYY